MLRLGVESPQVVMFLTSLHGGIFMRPTTIPPDKLCRIINTIPASFKQALRLVEYLAERPRTVTVEANKACAIGNLSDVAHKVNPILYREGYMIGCERSPSAIPNRFGEASNMFMWSVFALPDASNDADGGVL